MVLNGNHLSYYESPPGLKTRGVFKVIRMIRLDSTEARPLLEALPVGALGSDATIGTHIFRLHTDSCLLHLISCQGIDNHRLEVALRDSIKKAK